MFSLTEKTITGSFINASRKEVSDLALPPNFADLAWDDLDFLGWRDPKMGRRSYIVVPVDGEPVGVLLKQADALPARRAQCTWCQDVKLPNDVIFYSARRAGAAGRNGNTIGTLVCDSFQCSANVRVTPPMAYLGYDVDAARDERITMLRTRSAAFATAVQHGR